MSYAEAYPEANVQQDYVSALFAILRRRWLAILGTTFLLFLLLATGVQFLPKTYRAVASVEVLSKTPTVANPDILTGDTTFTDETAGTELAIFHAHELRAAVIQKLDLIHNPEFNPDLKPHRSQRLVSFLKESLLISRLIPADWLDWIPRSESATVERMLYDTEQVFATKVIAEPVSHSKIISVAVTTSIPALSALIANETVTQYIAAHKVQKQNAYKEAYEFSSERLPALRADMTAKNALVNQFKQQHHMVSGQYATILREKLSESSKQLVDAQSHLKQLEAQMQQAKRGDIMNNPAVLASQTIQRLREQQSQIGAEAVGKPWLAATYAGKKASVDTMIQAEALHIVHSLPDQVTAMRAGVEAQAAEVAAIQAQVAQADALQSELDPLENDARIATKQYTDFLTSDSTSRPDVAFTAVNVRMLSSAVIPYRAYFPNNSLMLPAAFVLSLLFSTTVVLYRGRRVGFVTAAQFQDVLRIDPIGRIPLRTSRTEQVFWEAVLFLSMKLCSPYEKQSQTILITSAQPDEGKTTIAMALAEVFARRNISVALVDADLRLARRPRRGEPPVVGLREVLADDADLEDAIIRHNGVSLVPAGTTRMMHPTSLIASDNMPLMLQRLRETHDIIIIDGPPAPIGGDSWALSKLVDRVLFVVKQGTTPENQVQDALHALDRHGGIDVVLNMVSSQDDPMLTSRMLRYYKDSGSLTYGDRRKF